jgi:hypothetical protein
VGIGINFFQVPAKGDILIFFQESKICFIASGVATPSHRVFNLLFPDPSEKSLSMAPMALRDVFLQ